MCSEQNKKMPGLKTNDNASTEKEYPQIAEYITNTNDPLGAGIKVRVFKSKCREDGGRIQFSDADAEQRMFEEFFKRLQE